MVCMPLYRACFYIVVSKFYFLIVNFFYKQQVHVLNVDVLVLPRHANAHRVNTLPRMHNTKPIPNDAMIYMALCAIFSRW